MKERSTVLKIWSVLYPAGLYLIMTTVASVAGVIGVGVYLYFTIGLSDMDYFFWQLMEIAVAKSIHITVLGAAATTPFLLLFMKNDRKRQQRWGGLKRYRKPPAWSYGLLVLLGIFLCYSGNNLIMLSGISELFNGFDEVAEILYQSNLLFELLAIGIALPYVEELIFRGLAYNRLKELVPVGPAIVLSALFFGVYHMNVVQGIYAFVLGLALAYVYEKFHSILAPVIIHAAANCLSVIISETEIFMFMYESTIAYLLSTVVALFLVIVLFVMIKTKINLEAVNEEEIEF